LLKVTESIFNAQSLDEATNTLGAHLPQGKAWSVGVEGSIVRDLISACARTFQISQESIEQLSLEYDISKTVDLIDEWEESVGIPDACLYSVTSIEDRRKQVIQRLRKQPIVKIQEMQAFVDDLFPNYNITLYTGKEFFSYEYDNEYTYIGDINERFVIVATVPFDNEFEYEYEHTYSGAPDVDKLRCVLEKVIPTNVVLHIEFISSGA